MRAIFAIVLGMLCVTNVYARAAEVRACVSTSVLHHEQAMQPEHLSGPRCAGNGLVSTGYRSAVRPSSIDTLQSVRVNGVELRYHESGSGEPIVFIHGGLVDLREWVPVARDLADSYRTVVYSRRYNFPNENRLSVHDHSAAVEADDLAALIRELDLGPAHLAGISYGGYTALLAAHQHPELVRSLVIVEPPLVTWARDIPQGRELYDDFMAMWRASDSAFARADSLGALSAALDWFVAPGAIDRIPSSFVARLMDNIEEWHALTTSSDPFPELTPGAFQEIDVPILLISGGRSYPLLQLIDSEIEKHIRVGHRHVVPDGTHNVCANQPATCVSLIREFLMR